MNAERPEKGAIRTLWLESIIGYSNAYPDDTVPLYLTLSGAEGKDIQLIVDEGLVETTDVGGIAESQKHRVIAVESNSLAVVELNRRFPGLKIFQQPFANLLRGHTATRWPTGEDEHYCKARVVNLDLNSPLEAEEGPGLKFPVLQWIEKLAQIHAQERLDWTLCLTLHGEVLWDDVTSRAVQAFLRENYQREPQFSQDCASMLGNELHGKTRAEADCDFAGLSGVEQQQILMVVVPKKIAQMVHHQGWRVLTPKNLRYGGVNARAPMVTWILDFLWDDRAFTTPDVLYRESLCSIMGGAGRIAEDGSFQ